MGGTNEGRIDLASLIHRRKLSEADMAAVDADLMKYEEQATEAFQRCHEAAMELQRAQELWQADMAKAREENDSNTMRISMRYQEMVGESSKRASQATSKVSALNRETIERILAKLPGDAASSLRSEFNRRAFPEVYNDDLAMESRLNLALSLEDLGDEQRRRLSELAAEYRPAYTHLSEQMVDISTGAETPSFSNEDAEGWQKWQERREAMGSLKFDRNELNLRIINQLRAILSEEHIRRIGGLPEPKKPQGYEMW